MRKRILLALFSLCCAVQLPAQELHWVNYQFPNELRETPPSLSFTGSDGLIWLATARGLTAFDGKNFTDFTRAGSHQVGARTMYEDRDKTLWIGYEDGTVDRLLDGELVTWDPEEGHPAAPVTGFAEDGNDRLWLSTYGEGAYVIADHRLYNFDTDDGLAGNDVYTIASLPNGEVWLGTDGGISVCKFNGGHKTVQNLTREDGLSDEIVRVILPDGVGNCWVGTHDAGVAYFNQTTSRFETITEGWTTGPVNDLALLGNRELIITTENQGIWRLDLKTRQLSALPAVAGNKGGNIKVRDVLPDAEGGLWILSRRSGLFRANLQLAFVMAPGREVQAVRLSRAGTLWAGTDAGLYRLTEKGMLKLIPETKALNIVSLFEDRFGNIWMGTFDRGVFIIDPETGTQNHLGDAAGWLSGSIFSIDGKGDRLWMVSLGGVTEVRVDADPLVSPPTEYHKVSGLKTDFVYQVYANSSNKAWFATDGEGLAVLNNETVTHLRTPLTVAGDSVDLRRVYSLTTVAEGSIWFSTARAGLFELNNDSLYAKGLQRSTLGESITALAPVRNDQLILSHPEGLISYNLSTNRYQEIFNSTEKLPNFRPILNAASTSADGQAWFGCSGGLIRFRAMPEVEIGRPRILLRSVSVYPDKKPVPRGKKFKYHENTLAFDFHGLWYTAPGQVRCRYQLEGYDPTWIETRNQRVIYSKLAPGNYTFRVAATANKSWENAEVQVFEFTISPPFWQRWWFIASLLLLAGATGNYLIRRRDRQLRRTALLQKQQIESQYEVLKSQINPHFLFNSFNTLISMIEESPADAVSYTEKLSDLFRNVLQYRNKEVIPLPEELGLLTDYLFLLEKRFGDKLRVSIAIPEKKGFIVPLSLQLLVENAIKHNVVSAKRPLEVSITQTNGHICVHNNLQPKLRKEPSTGFGLRSLSERYALLSSRKITTEKSALEFRVCIPVIPGTSAKSTA